MKKAGVNERPDRFPHTIGALPSETMVRMQLIGTGGRVLFLKGWPPGFTGMLRSGCSPGGQRKEARRQSWFWTSPGTEDARKPGEKGISEAKGSELGEGKLSFRVKGTKCSIIKVWERGHICLRNCLHIKHAVFTWLKYKFILGDWFHQLLTFYLSVYSYIYMHNHFLVGNCSIGFLALCLPPTPHLSWKCPFLCTPGYSKWGMAGSNFWGSRLPGNGSGGPWWEVGVNINPGFICRARESTHGPALQATCVGPHDPSKFMHW